MLKGQRAYAREWLIRGEIWRLKMVRKIDSHDSLGECRPDERLILIRQGQTRAELAQTLFHELVHSAEAEYGFDLKHSHVYKLEEAIYDLLLQNWDSLAKIFGR